MVSATSQFLRKVPLFEGLSESDLTTISDAAQIVRLEARQPLFAEGDAGDHAYVVREGKLEVFKSAGGRETLLSVSGPGNVVGEMAIVENAPRMASVRAGNEQTELIAIGKEDFDRLIATSHTAARVIFNTVLKRWRSTEAILRHSERMAQLGTLTAGIAHEMNNPAAAVKRGADQLAGALNGYAKSARELAAVGPTSGEMAAAAALDESVRQGESSHSELDPLERSDRESELTDWLLDRGLEEPWDIAPHLVEAGITRELLETSFVDVDAGHFAPLLNFVISGRVVARLAREVGIGAGRLSELVGAMKSYSYLDQAPVQNVDVHEGLDNTIVILANKLKKGITVRREYAPDLPRIEAYGSELNQVWTNLIDNAADAMNGAGELVLRTRRQGEGIVVEVQDSGSGIPAEIRPRVFDAFFTTKPPGKGTGLGLNVSYNIVVFRHRGSIDVESKPGMTKFSVWLPVESGGKGAS